MLIFRKQTSHISLHHIYTDLFQINLKKANLVIGLLNCYLNMHRFGKRLQPFKFKSAAFIDAFSLALFSLAHVESALW